MKYSQEFKVGSCVHSLHFAKLRGYIYSLPHLNRDDFSNRVNLTIGDKTLKVCEWGVTLAALRRKYGRGQQISLTAEGNFPENQLEKFIKRMGGIFEMDLE